MVKIENVECFGWDAMMRANRNPFKSHGHSSPDGDFNLINNLIVSGDDHGKALRLLHISFDGHFPRYIHSEMDTYRIGVEKVSESTVHTLLRDGASLDDFVIESDFGLETVKNFISILDKVRAIVKREPTYYNWGLRTVKQCMPESFIQKRTYDFSGQALRHVYFQRRNHPLEEWHEIISALKEALPPEVWSLITTEEKIC